MIIISTLLILFCFLPALVGHVSNTLGSLEKRTWYYLKIQTIKVWTPIEYALATFIACTSVLYVAGFLAMAEIRLDLSTYVILLLLCCLTALVYLCYYWKIPKVFAKHQGLLKVLFGAIAIGVATVSKIYSDAGIAELTGLSPQDLPGAQLLLTFLLTPAIWFMSLALLLGYLSLPAMVILLVRSMLRDFKQKQPHQKKRSNLPDITALMAVALFVLILLTITQKIASKEFYEPRLRQAIVFASFHLPTTYCGLSEKKGVEVAPLPDDRAATATPDMKLGYTFELIVCKPKTKEDNEVNVALNKIDSTEKKAVTKVILNRAKIRKHVD